MANSQDESSRMGRCPVHGDYESRRVSPSIWLGCPACAKEAEEARNAAEASALAQEVVQRRLWLSGLQGRFVHARFENFVAHSEEQNLVLQACKDFVESLDDQQGGLTLVGQPGTGKTHLGSSMVNALIRDHHKAAMIFSSREIVRLLRSTWGNRPQPVVARYASVRGEYVTLTRPETEAGMLDMLAHVPLLVIDEVGAQFDTNAEIVQLFDVIDARYKQQLPTVVLSNLTGTELKETLGDRAYDRLREGGRFLVCKWESHRRGYVGS